jgi:hypothetical protein
MLSRTGVLVVGVTSIARGSEGESEREREREGESPFVSLSQRLSSTSPMWQRVSATCLRKALDTPFYR